MSRATDLAKAEAEKAEAEDETTEPTDAPATEPADDAEAQEEAETPEQPDEPEQKARPASGASVDQQKRQFDRALSAFKSKLCALFEVDDLQPSETPGVVGFVLPGVVEKRTHGDFQRCPTCNGWGKVLTGSLTQQDAERDCPDPRCKGRGYWEKPRPVEVPASPQFPAQPVAGNGVNEWAEAPTWMGDPRLSSGQPTA